MNDMICCPLGEPDDRCELWFSTKRKAAKEHSCVECDRPIAKGEVHEFTKGLFEGYWFADRTCALCWEIGEHFECGGRTLGTLWEELASNFIPTMRAGGPCLDGLSARAKEALFEAKRVQMGMGDDGD